MANNIEVTPGTGKTVKTTEVGGVQIQHIVNSTAAGVEVDFTSGTAGSPAGGVSSVQGVSGGTSLNVNTTLTGTSVSVNGSSTNTSTDIFSATVPVNGFEFANTGGTYNIWINDADDASTTASASIMVPPGGSYSTPVGYKPIGLLRIIWETAASTYIARRW